MMPVDHLLLPEAEALPAIVVVRLPSGLTHFVVVWRAHGPLVQVMDPARGRRWVRRASFLRDVYRHRQLVPADAFAEWAAGDGFTAPLARRLRALGVAEPDAAHRAGQGERRLAAHRGAGRRRPHGRGAARSGAVARGAEASRLVDALAAARPAISGALYAFATPAPPADDGTAAGCRARGGAAARLGRPGAGRAARGELPLELQAAVDERPPRVARQLWTLARAGGPRAFGRAGGRAGAGRSGRRGRGAAVPLGRRRARRARPGWLHAPPHRGRRPASSVAGAAGPGRCAGWPRVAAGARRFGGPARASRRRCAHCTCARSRGCPIAISRRGRSRTWPSAPTCCTACARCRRWSATRPRVGLQILVVGAGLCVLDPGGAGWALALVAACWRSRCSAQPALAERDLRMRNHAGALGRFYLDGLLGLVAARTHRGEAALAREHRDRLLEWRRAARGALAAALARRDHAVGGRLRPGRGAAGALFRARRRRHDRRRGPCC